MNLAKKVIRIFVVLLIMTMVVSPVIAQDGGGDTSRTEPPDIERPTRPLPEKLPQEVLDMFEGGMSIEEFLFRNQGPIPNALLAYANIPVTVIVQLQEPSVIEVLAPEGEVDAGIEATLDQPAYSEKLLKEQDEVISLLSTQALRSDAKSEGITVISQYTKVMNGFLAKVPFSELNNIRSMPEVKSVTRPTRYEPNLAASVPLIQANDVWGLSPIGYKGEGIVVAVIDTGVDYTHAAFGGVGTPEAYDGNDPDIIEPGSFPTAKVIGGYDFAGTAYDANDPSSTPVPDADPLDEGGHGTHVASTVAGFDIGYGSGVAPEALIYALKVFGADGSTELVVDAIEWAMDPNRDGDISDHVDVINMSLGASFGLADVGDPEYQAVELASALGVFVVVSAGNSGNVNYVAGSPSVSDSAISVAASTTGFETLPFIAYTHETVDYKIPYTPSENVFTEAITAEMVDVDALDGSASGLLCETTGVSDLTGKIALISRGTCSFSTKINNAEDLGAVAVIVYNNTGGTISMATSGSTLPAGSILQSDGLTLKSLAPLTVTVGPDSNVETFTSSSPADMVATFSSRGPRGFDSKLKPEIAAPGVSIYAANMGSGNLGTSMSGTSMAAPHVAGVAALMKQAHPTWTNEQIKAAMMNTAEDLADSASNQVPRVGAGRVNALDSVTTEVVAVGDSRLVSLSWGKIEIGPDDTPYENTKTVTLTNFGSSMAEIDVSTVFTSSSAGASLEVSPESVDIPAGGSAVIQVTLTLDAENLPIAFSSMEEYYGFVLFEGDVDLRLPFYFVPRPYTMLEVVDETTTFPVEYLGDVDLNQLGPVASSVWAFPVVLQSDNDVAIADYADLRYVGMDYGGPDPSGDIISVAFSMWGPQHTNQPYWSEVDMYVDADQDGEWETVNFNWNYGSLTGSTPNNTWVIAQIDFTDGEVYLGSPYTIYADYNSGIQEWYLPAPWNYVEDTFSYAVESYDLHGMIDIVGEGRFDLSKPPLVYLIIDGAWDPIYYPFEEPFGLLFGVDDLAGYLYSKPEGIMLIDYHGKPGIGQVYFWELDPIFHNYFFPIIANQAGIP